MAITPDGERLFLAMEYSGLKRLLTRTGRVDQISDRICPENLAIDRQGKNLYADINIQVPLAGRAMTRWKFFDVEKEASIAIISGLPSRPLVQPKRRIN